MPAHFRGCQHAYKGWTLQQAMSKSKGQPLLTPPLSCCAPVKAGYRFALGLLQHCLSRYGGLCSLKCLGVDSEPILFLLSPLLNIEVDLDVSRKHEDENDNCPGAADPLICMWKVTARQSYCPRVNQASEESFFNLTHGGLRPTQMFHILLSSMSPSCQVFGKSTSCNPYRRQKSCASQEARRELDSYEPFTQKEQCSHYQKKKKKKSKSGETLYSENLKTPKFTATLCEKSEKPPFVSGKKKIHLKLV